MDKIDNKKKEFMLFIFFLFWMKRFAFSVLLENSQRRRIKNVIENIKCFFESINYLWRNYEVLCQDRFLCVKFLCY